MFKPWKAFRQQADAAIGSGTGATGRRKRELTPQVDGLEGRVVFSQLGLSTRGGVAARVAASRSGQVAGAAVARSVRFAQAPAAAKAASTTTTATTTAAAACPAGDLGSGPIADTQLQADLTKLRTDLDAVLAGSSVTDAQRLALRNDLRTIADAGFEIDRTALATATTTLLSALADGTYDSDATVAASIRSSFDVLFTDSGLDTTAIDTFYTDYVAVARGLNISTEELSTLSADRDAINADLVRLGLDTDHFGPGSSNVDLILGGGPGGGHRGGGGRGPGFGGGGRRH